MKFYIWRAQTMWFSIVSVLLLVATLIVIALLENRDKKRAQTYTVIIDPNGKVEPFKYHF